MINHKFVSYTFSPFFTFFPSPNLNFGMLLEKWECTNVFRIETLFPSAFIFLFPFFHPQPNFGVTGKNGVGPPNEYLFSTLFIYFLPVTGLLSEVDGCPNLGSANIGLLSLVRILDQNI